MAQNRVRPVGLFEGGHFFRAELDIDRLKDFLEMMRLGCADDGGDHSGCLEYPGAGDLSR